jgi:hypothetical protein
MNTCKAIVSLAIAMVTLTAGAANAPITLNFGPAA